MYFWENKTEMKKKHYVIKIDADFLEKMAFLRFKLNIRHDGEALKKCVEEFYSKEKVKRVNPVKQVKLVDSVKGVKLVKRVNSVNSVDSVKNIIDNKYVATNSVGEASKIEGLKKEFGLAISNNHLAAILKEIGVKQKRNKDGRYWMIKKK